ncbi:hypothetical protein HYH03_000603 [Edaphochlamys debaryana]|uniref:Uncharacterized protein n=1 Tax=Edaphochlamys debaryana TaxID=47281 RepID=A0A835YGG6_9CHLO|nr:hypothetical protein HYH03_000603 [Edaphochlamys debaryana]|eukprot:KAG2502111.1 hypothetical protein HYH03_000603 [Edaphochlamys debaryana]
MSRIVGSKWTAMQETLGWRHFRVIEVRKSGSAGVSFVQLQASCDTSTTLWLNATNLKDRDLWAAGWLQKSEMEDPAGALAAGVPCRCCSGSGSVVCPACDGHGQVMLPPSALGGVGGALGAGPSGMQRLGGPRLAAASSLASLGSLDVEEEGLEAGASRGGSPLRALLSRGGRGAGGFRGAVGGAGEGPSPVGPGTQAGAEPVL